FTTDAPAISGMSPNHAPVGAQVALTGTGLNEGTGVTLGGVNAPVFHVDSASQITVTVPSTGFPQARWRVQSAYGEALLDQIFTTDPPPVPAIGSLSLSHGTVGTNVVITGSNFVGVTAVTLGGINAAAFHVDTATQITAVVPNTGFLQARWRVVNAYGTGVYDPFFTTDPPSISQMSPAHAGVGQQVVLTGTGLNEATGVTLGGVTAPVFHVDSPTQITVTVPNTGFPQARWRVQSPYGEALLDQYFTTDM
ncbi:MAG TPA: IPT/TIG domain-containing protein, partial [Mycobacteriales bacterium]|nr:IPT/TIG domain-containing protein [Mycobacteriales bacterium]